MQQQEMLFQIIILLKLLETQMRYLMRLPSAGEEIDEKKKKGEAILDEEVTGEIEKIVVGREQLSAQITKEAEKELQKFGIQLIDVQLRRISYEKSVEQKVYERMISERQRIAQKIRSIGQGEGSKIEGRIQRDLATN